MCGIVAYLGPKDVVPVLMEGLKRLEYRGYDSAGVAVVKDGRVRVRRSAGRISVLEAKLNGDLMDAHVGIAHTRWATHGAPTEPNAHPHCDSSGKLALVHNGIIENYQTLAKYLEQQGITRESETDTEVLAKLIGHFYQGQLEDAVRQALREVKGTFGIAVVHEDEPEVLVAARRGSPLVIGIGKDEFLVASDAAAIVQHTQQAVYLSDNEVAVLTPDRFRTTTLDAAPTSKQVEELELTLQELELGGHRRRNRRRSGPGPGSAPSRAGS